MKDILLTYFMISLKRSELKEAIDVHDEAEILRLQSTIKEYEDKLVEQKKKLEKVRKG